MQKNEIQLGTTVAKDAAKASFSQTSSKGALLSTLNKEYRNPGARHYIEGEQ